MEEQIALFLTRFNRLKKEINNAPSKLSWLSKEREDLQELCLELERSYKFIERFLTTKGEKHTFTIVQFENQLEEYKRNYKMHVSDAAKPAELRYQEDFERAIRKGEEDWVKSGKTKEEFWEHLNKDIAELLKSYEIDIGPFNPLTDDPTSLIEEALWWGSLLTDTVMEDDEPERYEKARGAWRFFKHIISIDLSAVNNRWLAVPEIFIQPHVTQSDTSPIVSLYNEAVRAYVFGCNIASIAMCRALMEHILKNHYKIHGSDLENIIYIAEQRYPQLEKLKMQKKRLDSNKVLHDYEKKKNTEDRAVIDFLKVIKYLVQDVPR